MTRTKTFQHPFLILCLLTLIFSLNVTAESLIQTTSEQTPEGSIQLVDGSRVLVMNKDNGRLICNEVEKHDPNDNRYDLSKPDLIHCDGHPNCDEDVEDRTYMQFTADFNFNDVIIDSAELKFTIEHDEIWDHDGDTALLAIQDSQYDPRTLNWNNAPGGTFIHEFELQEENVGEDIIFTYSGDRIRAAFIDNNIAQYYFEPDGTDYVKGDVQCMTDDTSLTVYYRLCNPEDPCCDESGEYRPSGYVCKTAHNAWCESKNENGCDGAAYEDRCDGRNSYCPNNNYKIDYDSACTNQVCVEQSCYTYIYQPERRCDASTCLPGNPYECPNYLMCNDNNDCLQECVQDDDCIEGYICDLELNTCINGSVAGEPIDIQFDQNGNIINDEEFIYHYNDFNQLTLVKDAETEEVLLEITYNHEGTKVKQVDHTTNETTYYQGDFVRVKKDQTITDTTYTRFRGGVIAEETEGETLFYINNHLGSPALSLNSQGEVIQEFFFKPFGASLRNYKNRYQFSGKEANPITNLIDFGPRSLHPRFAIFLQPDSVIPDTFDPQTLNTFSYVRNNPYRFVDPSGNYLSPLDIIDYVSVVHSTYSLIKDPSWANAGWLAADIAGAALPGIGGFSAGGKALKAAKNAGDVAGAGKGTGKILTGQKNYDRFMNMLSGERIAGEPVIHVDPNTLFATHRPLHKEGLKKMSKEYATSKQTFTKIHKEGWNPKYVLFVRQYGDKRYLVEGHHRNVFAMVRGDKVPIQVYGYLDEPLAYAEHVPMGESVWWDDFYDWTDRFWRNKLNKAG